MCDLFVYTRDTWHYKFSSKKKDIIKYQCFSADWINDYHAMNCFSFEMTKQWLFFSSVFVFNFYFKLNYEGIINTEFFFPQLIIIYPLLGIKRKRKKNVVLFSDVQSRSFFQKTSNTYLHTCWNSNPMPTRTNRGLSKRGRLESVAFPKLLDCDRSFSLCASQLGQ